MSQLKDKSWDQKKPIYTTGIFSLEKNGRVHEKGHAKCTNPKALRVPLDRYPLPSPEYPLLRGCQTRRDKVPPSKDTGTPAPSRAVSQKQQCRKGTGNPPPFPVYQLPSSLTSLPVRSRQPPASDRECDRCHGTGRVPTNKNRASRLGDSTNRMETRTASKSSNGKRDAGSYRKNGYKNNRLARPKSPQGHALANKEEYVVVDPSDGGDDERDGWEMECPMGE